MPEQYDNPNWSHEMKAWISNIQWQYSTAASAMASRIKQLDFLWYEILHVSTELRAYCRKYHNKDYYLLKSVLGIGGITAAAILAELGDLRGFKRLDKLASLVGLVPGIYQSSYTHITLGLTRRSNRQVRSLLVEASWVAVRTDMALQSYYRRYAAKEPNKAIIKVAHKLLNRIRAVIISEVPYQVGLIK
ncbi:MAG: transposase [Sediminibacterium sp.]|nr:transposase [Sediminibacterium sp.]